MPSLDIAIAASVTWSRPWASVMYASRRVEVHRMGRLIWREAHEQTTLLVVEEDLGAEAAAHVGSDDPHLVLGNAEDEGAHQEAVHVRVLRRDPQRQVAGRVLEARDAGPRLHGVGDEPLVDDALLDDDVGALERGVDVAAPELPLEGDVPRRARVNLRGARLGRSGRCRHGRLHVPVHGHEIGRVKSRVLAVGDDDRDGVAHVAGHVGRQAACGAPWPGPAPRRGRSCPCEDPSRTAAS